MPAQSGGSEKSDRLKEELLEEVRDLLEQHGYVPGSGDLLLAVSGGVDSMVMMELLHLSGHAGAVFHFDHGLRGEEGEQDRALVEQESKARELPFYSFRTEAPKSPPERGLQNWARQERYRHLYEILEKEGYRAIATAHQADDRLETVLMGMLRGSGFRGVMGTPTEKERVVRPLNRIWKERLRAYAEGFGVPYREDPSNRSERFLRNRIRKDLLPPFKESFSEQEAALLRSLELLEESGDFLQEMGARERARLLHYDEEKGEYRIPKKALKESSAPRILLFELLHPFQIPHSQIEKILHGIDDDPGAQVKGEEWTLIRDREALILTPRSEQPQHLKTWRIPSLEETGNAPLQLELITKKEGISFTGAPYEAYLDYDKVRFPLTLRSVQKGDRFIPFGMKEGSKAVLEHLTDRKWPAHEKERAQVLCDAEGKILWVIGSTIHEELRVEPENGTKRILRVRFTPS